MPTASKESSRKQARPALAKMLMLGVFIALFGVGASITPIIAHFEIDIGLDWLFRLRGPKPPPDGVVLVSMDLESSESLGLPNLPRKWPRDLHARLIDRLVADGATAILFDVNFSQRRDPAHDQVLTESVARAGNVVLLEYMTKRREQLEDDALSRAISINIERRIPPFTELEAAAAALGPFVLPKVPEKVSQVYLFKPGAGGVATLPVIAYQYYAEPYREQLLSMLQRLVPAAMAHKKWYEFDVAELATELRQLFVSNPSLAEQARAEVKRLQTTSDPGLQTTLLSLIDIYSGANGRFIDYYGAPRTIPTVSYQKMLLDKPVKTVDGDVIDVSNKIVFVGFSESFQPEQKDNFYSVFSQQDGLDVSGVEIAATAYANFLEGRKITPLSRPVLLLLVMLLGFALSILFFVVPAYTIVPVALSVGAGYMGLAHVLFGRDGTWLPVIVPMLMQLPLALVLALLFRYLFVRKERYKLQDVFSHFLTDQMVDDLMRDSGAVADSGELIFGVCLSTDAQQYTSLSERMNPDQLKEVLNQYFEVLFKPVKEHNGFISDVVGDAMMAIWSSNTDTHVARESACLAALEIIEGVDRFNSQSSDLQLPTRIGLQCGEIMLGTVGAGRHYEYRAVGDAVNTASRIEGLNKLLGTRVLVSQTMIEGIDGLVTRELGSFRLAGKAQPLVIHELICRVEQQDENRYKGLHQKIATFEQGLALFRQARWQQARRHFETLLQTEANDGPANYYLALSQKYSEISPGEDWDAVISLTRK